MTNNDRIIGRLEAGFSATNARLINIERSLKALEEDYQRRQGGIKVMYGICTLIGAVAGAFGGIIKTIFIT